MCCHPVASVYSSGNRFRLHRCSTPNTVVRVERPVPILCCLLRDRRRVDRGNCCRTPGSVPSLCSMRVKSYPSAISSTFVNIPVSVFIDTARLHGNGPVMAGTGTRARRFSTSNPVRFFIPSLVWRRIAAVRSSSTNEIHSSAGYRFFRTRRRGYTVVRQKSAPASPALHKKIGHQINNERFVVTIMSPLSQARLNDQRECTVIRKKYITPLYYIYYEAKMRRHPDKRFGVYAGLS